MEKHNTVIFIFLVIVMLAFIGAGLIADGSGTAVRGFLKLQIQPGRLINDFIAVAGVGGNSHQCRPGRSCRADFYYHSEGAVIRPNLCCHIHYYRFWFLWENSLKYHSNNHRGMSCSKICRENIQGISHDRTIWNSTRSPGQPDRL